MSNSVNSTAKIRNNYLLPKFSYKKNPRQTFVPGEDNIVFRFFKSSDYLSFASVKQLGVNFPIHFYVFIRHVSGLHGLVYLYYINVFWTFFGHFLIIWKLAYYILWSPEINIYSRYIGRFFGRFVSCALRRFCTSSR